MFETTLASSTILKVTGGEEVGKCYTYFEKKIIHIPSFDKIVKALSLKTRPVTRLSIIIIIYHLSRFFNKRSD